MPLLVFEPMTVMMIISTVSVVMPVDIVVMHVCGADTNSELQVAVPGVGR